jgi:hypothetical protein
MGLIMLREQVLGKDRFDEALKTYVDRWAFKHPTPEDFFRTIENVSGEDLNWFWRSWFINKWELDQAVNKIKYIKNDPKQGVVISIENLEKMPMPVVLEIKTVSGTTNRVNLPVEIWQRNIDWSFKYPSTEEIERIVIDPDHVLPDMNSANNTWNSATGIIEKDVVLDGYLGKYSSKVIPITIQIVEENGKLTLVTAGQPNLPLEYKQNGKFSFDQAGLSVQFNSAVTEFTLSISGQSFLFTKDK